MVRKGEREWNGKGTKPTLTTTHPPSHAIFKFLLNEGLRSHAVNPPLIDASLQILSSVSESHAAEFSL